MRKLLVLGLGLAVACSPLPASSIPPVHDPIRYFTATPSLTPGPLGLTDRGTMPAPTPTPFNYTVRGGDTLGGIANHFHVTLDALLAANPDVNPNAMSVGQTLKIPSTTKQAAGGSPTPAAFQVLQAACHPASDGALWCAALAYNDSGETLENLTAQLNLVDSKGRQVSSMVALLPLDILPPHQSLPLTAFFPPSTPLDVQPQVQVMTAISLAAGDARYLTASVENTQVRLDGSGRSAEVSGQVLLAPGSKPAASVWVAAVAYDRAGSVVGVRRWESNAVLQPGSAQAFSMMVASIAGEIGRVEFVVEARP